ncbi:hypothetical protein KX816_07510 [Sphingosinicellaceae bacterium]|nr:hypothetical protein KX816_07510 [Sphingosinicellaceae bacterium]
MEHAAIESWAILENGVDRIEWISTEGLLLPMNEGGRNALGFDVGLPREIIAGRHCGR